MRSEVCGRSLDTGVLTRLPAVQRTLAEASAMCRHTWMRTALHQWIRSQGWNDVADALDAVQPTCSG